MSITLKICLPEYQLPEVNAVRVVLPIMEGTLTVIDGRAPSLQLLTEGAVQLLDNSNRVTKTWYINGGLADIAENVCAASAEKLIDLDSITLKEVEEKATNDAFYKRAYEYFKTFDKPRVE